MKAEKSGRDVCKLGYSHSEGNVSRRSLGRRGLGGIIGLGSVTLTFSLAERTSSTNFIRFVLSGVFDHIGSGTRFFKVDKSSTRGFTILTLGQKKRR